MRYSIIRSVAVAALALGLVNGSIAQDASVADPASIAFEEERWEDVITEYREILADNPDDRLAWLRIAQAQRELGRHEIALDSLEAARAIEAPPAMVELERSRNLAALGRHDEALAALETADHEGLRALDLLENAEDLAPLRDSSRFEQIYRNVRSRVYPCEQIPAMGRFDFWVGEWRVRNTDGSLAGRSTVTKQEGGCAIRERWQGTGGSSGTSLSFYLPSREQWRQVWVGSNGTTFDITGGWQDGQMRMEGTIEYVHLDRVVAFRGTWTVAEDGRVRQRLEEFDLGSRGWRVWFDGIYHPLDTSAGAANDP